MFNFIFNGDIGQVLAPVNDPYEKLYIAIQQHNNTQVQSILAEHLIDLHKWNKLGVAAIHIACKSNNVWMVDYLLNAGIEPDSPDSKGNTPLHFAAKNGDVALCQSLISAGTEHPSATTRA